MSLETASEEVLLIALADKIDNIQSIRRALEREGDELWVRFNRPKESQAWYYQSLVDVFRRRLTTEPGTSLVEILQTNVTQVFRGIEPDPGLA
jgi:hypothetical protein